jgi:hypothetical protein
MSMLCDSAAGSATSPASVNLFFPIALLTIALLVSHLTAAPITWGTPFNITTVGDIDTNGTLVAAKNATCDSNSPVVSVNGEDINFDAMTFGVSITSTQGYFTGGGGNTRSTNLNDVLNSHTYSGSPWSFDLTGLITGLDYQIQIVSAGDTRGCCGSRNQRAGDAESPENVSDDFSRGGVGSVIGTCTADSNTQTILEQRGSQWDRSGYQWLCPA